MCGIYGASFKNKKLVLDLIQSSSHRGPDGSGIWSNNEVTLGHNLLSITDEPGISRQPWVTPKGNILVFNGEVFNVKELRRYAIRHNYEPRTCCDTEILAWCLDEFGVEYTNNYLLDSMHAYAYYIKKEKQIFLSRDHAGVKPIYYMYDSGNLIFSSEIKGLLGVNASMPEIDKFAFNSFILTSHHITRSTVFRGIYKVLPGETFRFNLSERRLSLFSKDIVRPQAIEKFDPEELRFLLRESTLLVSQTDKKTALLLSGGLDSSSIAINISRNVSAYSTKSSPNYKEKSLSNGFVENHNEDHDFARRTAEFFGIPFNSLTITPDCISNSWSDLIAAIEEPSFSVGHPIYFETFRRLSLDKNVIVISGDFGDELLGGYPHHSYWKKREKSILTRSNLIKKWLKHMSAKSKPVGIKSSSLDELYEHLCAEIPAEFWNEDDPMNSWLALDCFYAASNNFMSRNDKFGMAFGMESRFPMATKSFMKYCLSICSDIKIQCGEFEPKRLLRQAYKNILPDYILEKPKTGWSTPIVSWDRFTPQMAALRESMLSDCSENWLNLFSQNLPGQKNSLSLYMLRQWFKNFGYSL